MVHEARRLGMSHANVYRHFSNKAALRNAVAARWLHAIAAQLDAITEQGGDAATRLEIWLLALVRAKQRKVLDEPEMFAAFHALAEAAHTAVAAHVAELERQLARIIADGVTAATMRFHHRHFVADAGPHWEAELKRMLAVLLAGLRSNVI